MDIKSRVQGIDPNVQARNMEEFAGKTGNIYESLVIIGKRSKQIAFDLKKELHSKLEEFATTTDVIEEIHENKEQIEISKFYERLPNTVIISMNEYFNDELETRYPDSHSRYHDDFDQMDSGHIDDVPLGLEEL